jgi:hypothetical protein
MNNQKNNSIVNSNQNGNQINNTNKLSYSEMWHALNK